MAQHLRVIIAGGGIGGLMLALMLERAGIDYIVLERSATHRPLGSAISINGTVLRVFEQLGLLEEIYKISKFSGRIHLLKEDLSSQGQVDLEHFKERPDLFQILVAHIPPERLIMGKRILSVTHTGLEVNVRCQDSSNYHGDILVGADGAYSAVRQCMHRDLKANGMLPRADSEPLKFDQNCVVGITNPLPPDRFPALKEQICEVYGIMGKKQPYTIWLIPIPGNRLAWSIGGRLLDSEVGRDDVRSFSFAEWWPEHAVEICDQVREYALPDFTKVPAVSTRYHESSEQGDNDNFMNDMASISDTSSYSSPAPSVVSASNEDDHGLPAHPVKRAYLSTPTGSARQSTVPSLASFSSESTCNSSAASSNKPTLPNTKPKVVHPTIPGTIGEIIDATPEERISKVMLESKLFKVWSYERTVLIGDACHKLLPFAGQGAIQAILDSVCLANALYDIESNTIESITKVFKKYTDERMPMAKTAMTGSVSFGKVLNVQGKFSDFLRRISFNHVPNWILRLAADRLHLYRPQLIYLPMVPDYGTAKAYTQKYSPRYLRQRERERESREAVLKADAEEAEEELQRIFNHHIAASIPSSVPSTPTRATHVTAMSNSPGPDVMQLHPQRQQSPRPSIAPSSHQPLSIASVTLSTTESSHTSTVSSERSTLPPPLPSQAPPHFLPNVYLQHHPEDKVRAGHGHHTPTLSSRASSAHTSPASSSYSLVLPSSEDHYNKHNNHNRSRRPSQSHGLVHTASPAHMHLTSRGVSSPVVAPPPPPLPLPPSQPQQQPTFITMSSPLVLESPLGSPTFRTPGQQQQQQQRREQQHQRTKSQHDMCLLQDNNHDYGKTNIERILSQQRSLEQLRTDTMSLSVMDSYKE
ncbi:hypothetical protein BG004_001671 [Podila humilis]|nr:hypothetical protein BG004_001671 [Podila humilis]